MGDGGSYERDVSSFILWLLVVLVLFKFRGRNFCKLGRLSQPVPNLFGDGCEMTVLPLIIRFGCLEI